jgi:hypothetical protein
MTAMSLSLEADVGLLHIAGGGLRATPPPGVLTSSAPRRAARGRADDLLFLSLRLSDNGAGASGFEEHLAHLAKEAFYRTPGSVTAALRQSAEIVNDHLRSSPQAVSVMGNLLMGVLRGPDIYIAQCGLGEAVLIRSGEARRFVSEDANRRPLGDAPSPFVRYHHFEVRPGDLLLLTPSLVEAWSDPVLKAISGFQPAPAIEQLSHSRSEDTAGLLLRFVPEGQANLPLSEDIAAEHVGALRAQAPPGQRREGSERLRQQWAATLGPIVENGRDLLMRAGAAASRLLLRIAPGLIQPPRPGEFSPAVMAATAILIPLVVLFVVSLVYFRRGRGEQFQAYLAEASSAIASAQAQSDTGEARQAWSLAQYWLEQASRYGESDELEALDAQVAAALDDLNLVLRLELTPLVPGGFGGNARLTHMAATASDVYILDAAKPQLWHTWATGRGYEIDSEFDCLDGADSIPGMGTPVDLAVQEEPGALGAEGVVAVDADGTLLYCAPDRRSLTGQIIAPDTGLGQIKAIDVFADTLYVLDPKANAVWLYDATGGVFSGEASIYFVEDVPDLSDAVDIAKSQEDLFILHADGTLDRCLRTQQAPSGGQIDVTCEEDLRFRDDRAPQVETDTIPDALITELVYSPPPEPSLFFLDNSSRSVYRYSTRMAYQNRIQPLEPLQDNVTAMTLGPPNDLFLAAGDQVYFVQLR